MGVNSLRHFFLVQFLALAVLFLHVLGVMIYHANGDYTATVLRMVLEVILAFLCGKAIGAKIKYLLSAIFSLFIFNSLVILADVSDRLGILPTGFSSAIRQIGMTSVDSTRSTGLYPLGFQSLGFFTFMTVIWLNHSPVVRFWKAVATSVLIMSLFFGSRVYLLLSLVAIVVKYPKFVIGAIFLISLMSGAIALENSLFNYHLQVRLLPLFGMGAAVEYGSNIDWIIAQIGGEWRLITNNILFGSGTPAYEGYLGANGGGDTMIFRWINHGGLVAVTLILILLINVYRRSFKDVGWRLWSVILVMLLVSSFKNTALISVGSIFLIHLIALYKRYCIR